MSLTHRLSHVVGWVMKKNKPKQTTSTLWSLGTIQSLCHLNHWKFKTICCVWRGIVGGKGWGTIAMILWFEERQVAQVNMWVLCIGNWFGRETCVDFSGQLGKLHTYFLGLGAKAALERRPGHSHDLMALPNCKALPSSSKTLCSLSHLEEFAWFSSQTLKPSREIHGIT